MLADEEITVVEGCGVDVDYEVVGARGGGGNIFERETVRLFVSFLVSGELLSARGGSFYG